jgi:hypothetical protein
MNSVYSLSHASKFKGNEKMDFQLVIKEINLTWFKILERLER